MKKNLYYIVSALFIGTAAFHWTRHPRLEEEERYREANEVQEAFDWWYDQRALPGRVIAPEGIGRAFAYTERVMRAFRKQSAETPWRSIGPDNVGGRVLSLAFDPESTNVLWAGSASGGLWRSSTAGAGADAWDYVNTGFNVLAVGAIAINPLNANEMYIGTGEISGYELGLVGTPGARTTYGLGIVKSTDRGRSWSATGLTWLFSQNRSVQKIVINPKNPRTIFAATSEGTYRSYNSGGTFVRIDSTLMAMDVALDPVDTTLVFIACGQRNTAPNPGLYKSTDGGTTFTKMGGGLPASNIGRTALAIAPSDHTVIYASIAHATSHATLGLYRSTNSGVSWTSMSTSNYMSGQGWYNNAVAVHPLNAATVITAGLDAYRSWSGGAGLTQRSYWYKGKEGVIVPGGAEGTDNTYAHADHHAIVFHPKDAHRVFFGNDGGIFESADTGNTFSGRNGGFVTAQFYNGFANAKNDSLIALGGLQDNGTMKYQGGMSWNKVYGGDGGWCAIDPANPNVLYEEYVNLAIAKSTDGGTNWSSIFTPASTDSANFIAPFVIAPSNPQVLYAGAEMVHKSTNTGATWTPTNGGAALNSVSLSCLAVSFTSAETLIAGTGKRANPLFELFFSTNGGTTWTKSAAGTPNRFPTDLAFDPSDSRIAYATFSGYGTPHVYRSVNAGASWTNISANLPDLPVQSVCVDPLNPADVYIGTDLGVYRSTNSGASWDAWFDGMPVAMVLDVAVSEKDHSLRAATFGNGVYQRPLRPKQPLAVAPGESVVPVAFALHQNFPNPFNPTTAISYQVGTDARPSSIVSLKIFDVNGKEVATLVNGPQEAGAHTVTWDASRFASGTYFARLQSGGRTLTRKMLLVR